MTLLNDTSVSKCAPRHSDPPKVHRGFIHFARSKCAPCRRESDSTRAEGSLRMLCSKCAPRHNESDLTHPKCAEGSLRVLKMCAAPQMRAAPQQERRGFASRSQNVHRATARAISLSQSDVPATQSTPRRQSTAPATKFARKAPKCGACHEIHAT